MRLSRLTVKYRIGTVSNKLLRLSRLTVRYFSDLVLQLPRCGRNQRPCLPTVDGTGAACGASPPTGEV